MMGDLVKPEHTLSLHASAVYSAGGAWIFLGDSGAGKSTIARLLTAEMEPLADDILYLSHPAPHTWLVGGADHGKQVGRQLDKQVTAHLFVPVRAVFCLYQHSSSYVEVMPPITVCDNLFHAYLQVMWHWSYDVQTKCRAFQLVAAAAREIPGYRLYFAPLPSVYDVIAETLQGEALAVS